MASTTNLTGELLSWAHDGGRKRDRPTTLNEFDCQTIHLAIGGLVGRGLIVACRVPRTQQDTFRRFMNLRLTQAGVKALERRRIRDNT